MSSRDYLDNMGKSLGLGVGTHSPFLTDKRSMEQRSAALFTSDYTPLFSKSSGRYTDARGFNPFAPNVKSQDIFQHLTSNPERGGNEYMKRLLDLHREGTTLNVNMTGVGSSGTPMNIIDKHPNSLIPIKTPKQSGGSNQLLNKLIGGGLSLQGTGFSPFGSGSRTHTNLYTTSFKVNPPKTSDHTTFLIRDFDQMVLKSDIKDKDTAKRLRNTNYMVVDNPDSFDPDKEYLFNYNKY